MFKKLRLILKARKPEILLGGAFLAIGAGVIYACNSSRELDDVLEDSAEAIDEIHETMDGVEAERAIRKERGKCAWELFKMYAPAVILIGGGFFMAAKSHSVMAERIEGLSLKLAETTGLFAAYRGLVRRDLGDDADRHFMYDTAPWEEEIPEERNDEGAIVRPAKTMVYSDTVDSGKIPKGAIIFDERSIYYDRECPENNVTFLHLANEDLERELRCDKFLFNERIMTRLGLQKFITADDKVTGHTYDGRSPIIDPDTGRRLFDLGLFNAYDRQMRLNGELGKTFILYPTSYGYGSEYILDKFEASRDSV